MPKRDQHYVPQFYLRFFSSEEAGRTVSLYSLRSGKIVDSASIRDQCARRWFYGKDEVIENRLAEIEGETAGALHRTREDRRLPPTQGPDHLRLLIFAAVQGLRTNRAVQEGLEGERKFSALAFHGDEEAEARLLGGPPPYTSLRTRLGMAGMIARCYRDLSALLIAAPRHHAFLTSDHPVALYNEYMQEQGRDRGTTGTAAAGLQVFLPLSPNLCILFFDGDIYRMLLPRRGGLARATEGDLAQINRLQVLEAENCLYFHAKTDERLIRHAVSSGMALRDTVGPRVALATSDNDERRSLLHQYRATANLNLNLSFLKLSQSARQSDRLSPLVRYRPAAAAIAEEGDSMFRTEPSPLQGMTFHLKERL